MGQAEAGIVVHVSLGLDTRMREIFEQRFAQVGATVRFVDSTDELHRHLHECQYLLVGRPPRIDWGAARELVLLQVAGTGVDPLFPALNLPEQVQIANQRGPHEENVRDHVIALLLALARDLPRAFALQKERTWAPYSSAPLLGKRLTLLGYGGIGRRVAPVAKTLGMRVRAIRRAGGNAPGADECFPVTRLEQALVDTEFLVLALPLTSSTRGLVNRAVLERLPPRAWVINVSRGGILDEAALEGLLRSGRLAGAALDVFAEEPLPASSSLWSCPGLVITPHVAGSIPDYFERVLDCFVENVTRVRNGHVPASLVSRNHNY